MKRDSIKQEHISIAKYVYKKIGKQINNPNTVISSRFNIPETLIKLGIRIVDENGKDIPLTEVYSELGKKITLMELRR